MRRLPAALSVLVAVATNTGCFPHCRDPAICLATGLLHVAVKESDTTPSQSTNVFNVPKRPLEIAGLHHRFTLPYGFVRDPETKRQVFRDEGRVHAVRIEIYPWVSDEFAFLEERYPGAPRFGVRSGTRELVATTVAGTYRRVTTAVIVRDGKLYELACSQAGEALGSGPDAVCNRVLTSFQVD